MKASATILGPATYDKFQATRHFSALDGLRALSVIAVIWQHTSGNPGPEFFSKGRFGVHCFFAISGFLITTLLVRERDRTGRISLKGFYIRRTLRIMPIYYLVLGAYVLLVFALRQGILEGRQFFMNLPAFLTYTSNWFVDLSSGNSVTFYFAWSLATEEQFYLFWPVLLVVTLSLVDRRRPGTVRLPLFLLLLIIGINQVALLADTQSLLVTIVASLALPILLGSAAALALSRRVVFDAVGPILSAAWFAPTVILGVLASLIWNTPGQVTEVALVLLVASLCVTERTVLHPVLRWRPLVHVGIVSYGIYLMHMLCANAIRLVLPDDFGLPLFVCTTFLAAGLATVSYYLFEGPLQRLGRRLSHRADQRARRRRLEPGEPAGQAETAG